MTIPLPLTVVMAVGSSAVKSVKSIVVPSTVRSAVYPLMVGFVPITILPPRIAFNPVVCAPVPVNVEAPVRNIFDPAESDKSPMSQLVTVLSCTVNPTVAPELVAIIPFEAPATVHLMIELPIKLPVAPEDPTMNAVPVALLLFT